MNILWFVFFFLFREFVWSVHTAITVLITRWIYSLELNEMFGFWIWWVAMDCSDFAYFRFSLFVFSEFRCFFPNFLVCRRFCWVSVESPWITLCFRWIAVIFLIFGVWIFSINYRKFYCRSLQNLFVIDFYEIWSCFRFFKNSFPLHKSSFYDFIWTFEKKKICWIS